MSYSFFHPLSSYSFTESDLKRHFGNILKIKFLNNKNKQTKTLTEVNKLTVKHLQYVGQII